MYTLIYMNVKSGKNVTYNSNNNSNLLVKHIVALDDVTHDIDNKFNYSKKIQIKPNGGP